MTKPTLESLNEAARAGGYKDWAEAVNRNYIASKTIHSIYTHALTLDKLHGRKEVSEAETLYREVMGASLGRPSWSGEFDDNDREAIALIEAKFAELRAPKEPQWIAWFQRCADAMPVHRDTVVDVKLKNGMEFFSRRAGGLTWTQFGDQGDIEAYRERP